MVINVSGESTSRYSAFLQSFTSHILLHWCTCCQRDHISVKTVRARPLVENATFSRRLQSHLPRHYSRLAETTW